MFYRICRYLLKCTFKWYFKLEVEGLEHVPTQGGLLIASNHVSYLDPPLMAVAMPRPIAFFARDTLFNNPLFGRLITALNALPVKRNSGDRAAMKMVQEKVAQGLPVLIFPEGTRSLTGELQPIKSGIALLALKAQKPILPVRIIGAFEAWPKGQKWPQKRPIQVKFGPIIPVDSLQEDGGRSRENIQQLAEKVEKSLKSL